MKTTKKRTSELSSNRRWMQLGFVIVTLLIGLRHIIPSGPSESGAFDSFCPFGGIETLLPYLSEGTTLKTTSLMNFSVLLAVVGVSIVAGRAFCGWMCPLGTIQGMLGGWARRLSGEKKRPRGKASKAIFPLKVPPKLDRSLRLLKYGILLAILAASMFTVFPPLRNICPARAIFSFRWNTPLLGLVLIGFIASSMLVKRFTCKYLCPLGAGLALFNKFSLVHPVADEAHCNHCGRCDNECPVDIEPVPDNLRSAECIRCLECLETCTKPDAMSLRVG